MTSSIRLLLLFLCLPLVLFAGPSISPGLVGVWAQDGYGRILHVEGNTFTEYHTCAISCSSGETFTEEEFFAEFTIEEVTDSKLALRIGLNCYTFKKLDRLPDLCANPDPALKNDPLHNFETLWQTYQENYCYFEEREINWEAIGDRYRSKITKRTTPFELYLVLEEMIAELGDGHSFLEVPYELEEAYQARQDSLQAAKLANRNEDGTKKKRIGINIDKTLSKLTHHYIPKPKTYNGGLVKWGMINDEVGYVQINGMMNMANYDPSGRKKNASFERLYAKMEAQSEDPFADEVAGAHFVMKKVLTDIGRGKACIIDLRFNGGGIDEVGLAILSYFSDEEEVLAYKKARMLSAYTPEIPLRLPPSSKTYPGEVFILTSYFTASAAEVFMLGSLTATPDAIRVGSPTEGIFSDILGRYLPNGWYFGLSNEVYLGPDGANYENKGIAPHHVIDYNKSKFWFLHQLKEELPMGDAAINKVLKLLADAQ